MQIDGERGGGWEAGGGCGGAIGVGESDSFGQNDGVDNREKVTVSVLGERRGVAGYVWLIVGWYDA